MPLGQDRARDFTTRRVLWVDIEPRAIGGCGSRVRVAARPVEPARRGTVGVNGDEVAQGRGSPAFDPDWIPGNVR